MSISSLASSSKRAGFTLIEVLVALAVFSIASAGFLYATNNALNTQEALEIKYLASVIAENKFAALRLAQGEGIHTGSEALRFAKQDWEIDTRVEPAGIAQLADLKEVSVAVRLRGNSAGEATVLTGLVGKH